MTYQPHPLRFQLRRTKGWRMPAGGVKCARPSRWGNPFVVTDAMPLDRVLAMYREYLERQIAIYNPNVTQGRMGLNVAELRGKPLGCFCPLDRPCHVDHLAELANQ